MNYWWVNHKQTFTNEIDGGYIWSPTRNKNGSFNQTYDNLTKASVGDTIFSYADTKIKAIGIVKSSFENASVPPEFGKIGDQWHKDGYLVKVEWDILNPPFKPKDFIESIADLLPTKYSPLQKNGNGNQGVYLAKLNTNLGEKLIELINYKNVFVNPDIEKIKEDLLGDTEQEKIEQSTLPQTEKEQLINARVGQGAFKNKLSRVETHCRVTGISNLSFLTASHIKPWSESNNSERLDGNNGLLLSPHIDKLFDKGWISFSNNGDMLIKPEVEEIIKAWKISAKNVGKFNPKQCLYLAYHREKFKF